MSYKIHFDDLESTQVCARSSGEVLDFGQMFERFGKMNIVVRSSNGVEIPFREFRRRHSDRHLSSTSA